MFSALPTDDNCNQPDDRHYTKFKTIVGNYKIVMNTILLKISEQKNKLFFYQNYLHCYLFMIKNKSL